ncbi:hypothetical protein [Oceaniferula marina]|uniref:hypothetical protein n=1 Tax=Oceaniferula marina TaxID=2748318 RepID=UPI0015BADA2A|nr:hypothetical protein [Oceaniferula marina]
MAKGKQVDIQFRTFSVSGDLKGIHYYTDNGSVEIEVPSGKRSAPFKYRGEREMIFFRKRDQVSGQEIVPLAKVMLQGNLRNPLLVFIRQGKDGESDLPYSLKVLEDDPRDFTDGTVKLMNLTNKPLHIELGQGREIDRVLKPYQILSYRLPEGFKGNLPLKISMRYGKRMEPLIRSRVFPSIHARDIYFIWPNQRKGAGNKVKIATLRERGDTAGVRLDL